MSSTMNNTHAPQSNTFLSSLASSFKTKIKYNQGKYIDTGHIWREEEVTSSRKGGKVHYTQQEKQKRGTETSKRWQCLYGWDKV